MVVEDAGSSILQLCGPGRHSTASIAVNEGSWDLAGFCFCLIPFLCSHVFQKQGTRMLTTVTQLIVLSVSGAHLVLMLAYYCAILPLEFQ